MRTAFNILKIIGKLEYWPYDLTVKKNVWDQLWKVHLVVHKNQCILSADCEVLKLRERDEKRRLLDPLPYSSSEQQPSKCVFHLTSKIGAPPHIIPVPIRWVGYTMPLTSSIQCTHLLRRLYRPHYGRLS